MLFVEHENSTHHHLKQKQPTRSNNILIAFRTHSGGELVIPGRRVATCFKCFRTEYTMIHNAI